MKAFGAILTLVMAVSLAPAATATPKDLRESISVLEVQSIDGNHNQGGGNGGGKGGGNKGGDDKSGGGEDDKKPRLLAECDGVAPQEIRCSRAFTLQRDFVILISFELNYTGALVIRGFTPTGAVTVVCYVGTVAFANCPYWHEGVFIEGQTFQMEVAAPARGYWRIRVEERR